MKAAKAVVKVAAKTRKGAAAVERLRILAGGSNASGDEDEKKARPAKKSKKIESSVKEDEESEDEQVENVDVE